MSQPHFSEYLGLIKRKVKAILNLTPNGKNLNIYLRKYTSLVDCSTLIWMEHWPEEGFQEMGRGILETSASQRKPKGADAEHEIA